MSDWWEKDTLLDAEQGKSTQAIGNNWWEGDQAVESVAALTDANTKFPSSGRSDKPQYNEDMVTTPDDDKGLLQTVSDAVTGEGQVEYGRHTRCRYFPSGFQHRRCGRSG